MLYTLISILLVSQNEACLDVLVRSLTQIFTPIIETTENRVQKSHNVDDLTQLYKRDETGNFVLRDESWLAANPFVKSANLKSSKFRSVFEQLGTAPRSVHGEEVAYQPPAFNITDYEEEDTSTSTNGVKFTSTNKFDYELSTDQYDNLVAEENISFNSTAGQIKSDEIQPTIKNHLSGQEYPETELEKNISFKSANDDQMNDQGIHTVTEDYFNIDEYLETKLEKNISSKNTDDQMNTKGIADYLNENADYSEINNEYHEYYKPRYYKSRQQPLVDFLIKSLEIFQVTKPSSSYFIDRSKFHSHKSFHNASDY